MNESTTTAVVKLGKTGVGTWGWILLYSLLVLPLFALLWLPFPWWMGAGGM